MGGVLSKIPSMSDDELMKIPSSVFKDIQYDTVPLEKAKIELGDKGYQLVKIEISDKHIPLGRNYVNDVEFIVAKKSETIPLKMTQQEYNEFIKNRQTGGARRRKKRITRRGKTRATRKRKTRA
jgi:hypothetical protein